MIKSIISWMSCVIFLSLVMWLIVSWIDVLMHNDPLTGDHNYMPANAFVVMTQIGRMR